MQVELNWAQKWAAIRALDPRAVLATDIYGDWYVECHIYVGEQGVLSGVGQHLNNPIPAIEAFWREIIDIKPQQYIKFERDQFPSKRVRWNGFMWADVPDFELQK